VSRFEEFQLPNSVQPRRSFGVLNLPMTLARLCVLSLPLVLATACGGSGKSSESPAAATAGDTAAKAEAPKLEATDVTPKSESSKPKQEATESSGPECKKDKDCMIFSDCCTCKAVLAADKPPVPCEDVCGEFKCEVKGKTADNVACVAGHCKIK